MSTAIQIKERLLAFEASRWVGTKEIGGDNRGQIVEMFQKAVDGKAQGEPWCLAFAQFCISIADQCFDAIQAASGSQSPLKKTEHVLTLWKSAPILMQCEPKPGCLMLWNHWKDGVPTSLGHVGIVIAVNGDEIITVEGNTSGGPGVTREGDGVFRRVRSQVGSGDMRVLGFLSVWI